VVVIDALAVVQLRLLVVPQDLGGQERTDVQAHAVVEVRVPADVLLDQGLPEDKDVIGLLALQDELQPAFEV
jgi:hypothetical protein